MSEILQAIRGMNDVLPDDSGAWQLLERVAREIFAEYGYREIRLPLLERTELFKRAIGEFTDVVEKEMYTFDDRGGDSVTLRPEATAGIVRACISNGLLHNQRQKVWCMGPMFRYERPQKGRYRQFHQIDIEVLGSDSPLADAEVIACGWNILQELGVAQDTVLEVNTLGDKASRDAYRAALIAYFSDHKASLSEDSLARLERNPLRIVDSKDEGDRRIVAGAPTIHAHLTPEAAGFYAKLQEHLTRFAVPFRENPRIVRGLDYYSHTAFEFVTERLGSQGTVMGGGRYDGLVEEMGGPHTPCVGWAAGIERLSMLMANPPAAPASVAVIPVGDAAEGPALDVVQALRKAGIRAEIAFRGNVKRRMERANKTGARAAVILGETELASGTAQLKDLVSGEQAAVPIAELAARLK